VDLRHQTLHLAEEGWGSSHPAWLWVMIKWYLHNAREWWRLDWKAPSKWKIA
jgi:hypothetical protein